MLCHEWTLQSALHHIRRRRPVQVNYGFIQQLVDLEHKLDGIRKKKENDHSVGVDQCKENNVQSVI